MYEWISKTVENTSNFMYSYLLIILLLAVGLYFTFRTRFVQLRMLGESIRLVTEKSSDKNSVSAFQALMVSTASRVGTGNIVGVANAIAMPTLNLIWTVPILQITAIWSVCPSKLTTIKEEIWHIFVQYIPLK